MPKSFRLVGGRLVVEPPRITILVIASSNLGIYAGHEACWRTYARAHPNVRVYFIRQSEEVKTTHLNGDTIWSSGSEATERVFEKTVAAFQFLPADSYDYLVRTNLSSVWNVSKLLEFCKTLPETNVYCGVLGDPGISGAGMILSPDVVNAFVNHATEIERSGWDDIDFGTIAQLCGIPSRRGHRYEPHSRAEVDACWNLGYHYYLKNQTDGVRDLETELDTMQYLIARVYFGHREESKRSPK